MGIYSDKAGNNFRNGYNCAQAVLLAFARELHLEESFALKLASSFGGGMGRLREVCGAVSAMFMIAGILKGYTEPNNDELKAQHYKLIQKLEKDMHSAAKVLDFERAAEIRDQLKKLREMAKQST